MLHRFHSAARQGLIAFSRGRGVLVVCHGSQFSPAYPSARFNMDELHPVRILIVDDNPQNLVAVTSVLEHADHELVTCTSGAEALLVLRDNHDFAVILMDVRMPIMDGLECVRRIKQQPSTRDIPIIFVTAEPEALQFENEGYAIGAVDYLMWPLDRYMLRSKVAVFSNLYRVHRKLQELAVRESDARFRDLWESSRDALMLSFPPDWKLTGGNATAVALFGARDAAHLATFSPADLSPERQPDGELSVTHVSRAVEQVLREGSGFFELMHKRLDGTEFPCEVRFSRITLGGKTGVQATLRNITERKRLEQALRDERDHLEETVQSRTRDLAVAKEAAEAATRAKSDFLANMSHEVRSPMSVIIGYADALLDPNSSPDDQEMAAAAIRRNGQHLLQVINDVLDLSRIEAGKMPVKLGNCDPWEMLQAVIELYQVKATEKQIELTLAAEGPVPQYIRTDATRLRQILMNFLSNALKFSECGKRLFVTMGVRHTPRAVWFSVTDQGIGMSPEQVARLFQPFEQMDNTITRRYGGTGLGLRISKLLAEAMGGSIDVQSSLGCGSTFRLLLPLEQTSVLHPVPAARPELFHNRRSSSAQDVVLRTAPTPERTRQITRSAGVGRVLLIEDSIDLQKLMAFRLARAGYEVTTANNGRIGVDLALQQPFDLILTDIQMPEMDGLTATIQLRKSGYVGPIIGLSAHAMKGEREKNLAAGMDEYLTKPVTDDVLLTTIQHFTQVARAAESAANLTVAPDETDDEFAALLQDFLQALPARLVSIQRALDAGERELLAATAYQLKGTAASYEVASLSEAASLLDSACREGHSWELLAELVAALQYEITRLAEID